MSRPSRIAIVKELGARSPRSLAAHAVRGQDAELVVVERYPAALGADVLAGIEDDTRDLVALEHTNVATLIATVKLKGDVAVLSEWVDGESLASVLSSPQKPSLEVLLRGAMDALDGIGALHAMGGRVVGALGSEDVFLGVDGVTRITRFALGRVPAGALGARRIATMSPEFLRGERTVRGDVFTAGTLLWECFMGQPLFADPAGVDAQLERLASPPPRVDPSKREPWAAGLADVIARALSIDPAARYETAGELSRAVAAAVPSKVATRSLLSQYVARAFGEQIEARLAKLEPKVDVSFSMLPSTTQPPPVVETKPLAKLPDIPMPALDEAKRAAPEPALTPISAASSPVAAPAIAPTPAVVATGASPSPSASSNAEPTPNKAAAANASPVRKPAQSTPDATSALARARKAVPLPKRDPESSPNMMTAPKAPSSTPDLATKPAPEKTPEKTPAVAPSATKTNGAVRASPAKSPAKNVPLPKPKAEAPVIEAPLETQGMPDVPKVKVHEESVPGSAREDLDVDVDLVSVRPPPIAAPAKKSPPPPPATVKDAPSETKPIEPKPKRASTAPPKSEIASAAAAPSRDSDTYVYAPRNPLRGPLIVLGGIVLLAGGFAAGRLTAPDPWPPTPTIVTPTATTTSATTSATATSATATTTTATTTSTPTPSARASTSSSFTQSPFTTSTSSSASTKPDAGGHYSPNGI